MRPLTRRPKGAARCLNAAAMAAAVLVGLIASPALARCPWIVQPNEKIGGDLPDYEIMFTGEVNPSRAYYAFTVADRDLAWELSAGSGIAALDDRTLPLVAVDDSARKRYRADDASVTPLTIYLVASTAPLPQLEAIDVGFEPERPLAVGFRVRGASDTSGPLPHRSLPGIEIHHASRESAATGNDAAPPDYQLCAYQVRLR